MKTLLTSLLTLAAVGSAHSASVYIGDAAAATTSPIDNGGADTANGGNVTYALHENPYTNVSGSAELIQLTEVNFWSDAAGGTVTPYVAVYNGGGIAASANYTFLSIGDGIAVSAGVNNASFDVGGSNPTVTVNNGETIVAGFHQSGGIVPFGAGTADYLDEGNELGAGVGGTFSENAQWSTLGRSYSLNIGFDVVPEPSSIALLIPTLIGGLLLTRRRRK